MMHFAPQADSTAFGAVRQCCTRASSPISDVLFVDNDEALRLLAELLGGDNLPEDGRELLLHWMRTGHLKVGTHLMNGVGEACPVGMIDLQRIPARADCRVVFLPPFYLVHLLDCEGQRIWGFSEAQDGWPRREAEDGGLGLSS